MEDGTLNIDMNDMGSNLINLRNHPVAREVRRGEDMMRVFWIARVMSPCLIFEGVLLARESLIKMFLTCCEYWARCFERGVAFFGCNRNDDERQNTGEKVKSRINI